MKLVPGDLLRPVFANLSYGGRLYQNVRNRHQLVDFFAEVHCLAVVISVIDNEEFDLQSRIYVCAGKMAGFSWSNDWAKVE